MPAHRVEGQPGPVTLATAALCSERYRWQTKPTSVAASPGAWLRFPHTPSAGSPWQSREPVVVSLPGRPEWSQAPAWPSSGAGLRMTRAWAGSRSGSGLQRHRFVDGGPRPSKLLALAAHPTKPSCFGLRPGSRPRTTGSIGDADGLSRARKRPAGVAGRGVVSREPSDYIRMSYGVFSPDRIATPAAVTLGRPR